MSPSPTSSPLPCALFTSRISPTEVQPSSLCTYPWSQTLQSGSLSTIQQFSRPPTSWSTEARKAKHSFTGSLAARVSQADTALQQKVCLTPWSCCGRDFSFCLHCHRYWGRNGLEPHYGWELVGDSCVITEHVALNLCSPRNTINSLITLLLLKHLRRNLLFATKILGSMPSEQFWAHLLGYEPMQPPVRQ